MERFSRFILRWARWVATIGLLLSILGGYFSVQLYQNLRTDLEELLPTTARSVIDLGEVSERLLSIDNLAILVFSKNTEASRRFVDDLAAELKKAPPEIISSVEYKISEELAFFRDRRPLYMEVEDLKLVRNYIRDRLEYERALYNPLNIFSEQDIPEPTLDLDALRRKYDERVSAYTDFPDGYYATQDETRRVVLVYMPAKKSGLKGTQSLKSFVVDSVARLNPRSYAPDLEIHYSGGVQNVIEEQAALVADLELSMVLVMLLTMLVLWIFFQGLRASFALLTSLLMGVTWTFGSAYFLVGFLNANSAFLGGIIIGNGINFGVILLARYLEERRNGKDHDGALTTSMTHTVTATWTAALAAGLAYGSLMLTGFRGFKQFGVIGLVGMVLCWISAFTLLPAILTILDRRKTLVPRARQKRSWFAGYLAVFVSRYPSAIWATSFILTVFSLAMFARFDSDMILETDLRNLRSKESAEHGSMYYSRFVDEIFQRYLTPVVILPRNPDDTLRIADRLLNLQKKQGRNSIVRSVQTIHDFVPTRQREKIRILKEIRSLLPFRIVSQLPEKERGMVDEFLTPETMKPIRLSDLPDLLLDKFKEKDGSFGKLILVSPPPPGEKVMNKDELLGFIQNLRTVTDEVAPGTPVAGGLVISSDLISSISRDGPRATLFALLAVIILVVFLFRSARTVGLVLFALCLGVIWMAGAILAFDLKINFLNFIALPITFGIGVDYGVNVFQRYREEGRGSILKVIRDTGGAVGLCSLTTMIGYGSLLIAQNRAFVSFGLLAVLGEVTCFIAAVAILPAYLLLLAKRREE